MKRVMLWGRLADPTLRIVRDALARLGHAAFLLDQDGILDITADITIGRGVQGTLRSTHDHVDLSTLAAVYPRPFAALRSLGVATPAAIDHAVAIEAALLNWLEVAPVLVVNPPEASASNLSKPYQALLIRSAGFAVPDTLITTDAEAALAFQQRHGQVVYKSISGTRSIVERLSPTRCAELEDLRWCPTQFQEYIPGREWRVHVIGEKVFATEIVSDADDYRYADRDGSVEMKAAALSKETERRFVALAAALGLRLAGIDARLTPSGEWVCFEVNPSPGFAYFEERTLQPIGDAVAELLVRGG